ncbi:MAG: hypothetical protein K8T20_06710 [Planctomycetes bacterium]|nr:hypothetical protein [Planctomycetota bacterium]
MSLLDDLWAQGDREGVLQRSLPLMHESPVLFGGMEGLRQPFLGVAVKAWDEGGVLPRVKALRPVENALLFALRDLYSTWAAGLEVSAPAAGEEALSVSGVIDDVPALDSGILKVLQLGSRYLTPEEISALAALADKSVRDVLWGLAKAETSARGRNAERAKLLDKFALARATGKSAESLAAWAVTAREGVSVLPSEMDAGIGWPSGTAGKRIAQAREHVLKRLLQGKPVYEPEPGAPSFEKLSRLVDDDLPKAEADSVSEYLEGSMPATKATGRIARLSALIADAVLGTWEPEKPPAGGGLPVADLASWSAGGRADVDAQIASSAPELARAIDVFRALASREGRTLATPPADALPKRTVTAAPAVAAIADDKVPKIQLRGWPNRLEIVKVPEGVKIDDDGHVKAFAWKAGDRDVLADVSSTQAGVGVRLRVRTGGAPTGGIAVVVSGKTSRKTYSTRPTDTTGEVVVRGMPLQSLRIEVDHHPVDVVIES